MTHEQAQQQHAAERYLLGELHAGDREEFEEHLFGCQLCAADVRDDMLLLRSARQQFVHGKGPAASFAPRRRVFSLAALAASLLLIVGYQNLVQVPRLHRELAMVEAPGVMRELVLAGAGARGGPSPAPVRLSADDSLLLAVDIPDTGTYEKYVCSLVSPGGKLLWQIEITPSVAENATPLRVPARHLFEGENILRIQGFSRQTAATSAPPVDLATYRFNVALDR